MRQTRSQRKTETIPKRKRQTDRHDPRMRERAEKDRQTRSQNQRERRERQTDRPARKIFLQTIHHTDTIQGYKDQSVNWSKANGKEKINSKKLVEKVLIKERLEKKG